MTRLLTSNIEPMEIATSRFGTFDALEDQIIEIQGGLLGFPDATRYVRIPVVEAEGWLWLQSVDDPDLAFLAVTAFLFFPDYDVDMADADAAGIGLDEADAAEVLALVTVRRAEEGSVQGVTANLLGPVVINTLTSVGRQVVLSDSRYSTRETVAG